MTVINADGLILGRMASAIAKRLLLGEEIVVINAQKAVVSGKKDMVIRKWKGFLDVGGRRGPFHQRHPDRIVRRTIRGMLPYRKGSGRNAMRLLRVHVGVPREFRNVKVGTIEDARLDRLKCKFVTLGELAKEIGYTGQNA
ncbi:MAG: 50S ribosomal protein L13 [Candidatus Bathyarchaeia archaeon]